MVVNHERNPTPIGGALSNCRACASCKTPFRSRPAELAQKLASPRLICGDRGCRIAALPHGGFRIYDVSNPSKPKLMHHPHASACMFRYDERASYSTEMEGFVGNILVFMTCAIPKNRTKFRVGGCRDRILVGGKSLRGQANATAYTTRYDLAMRCGRAVGMGAFASLMLPIYESQKRSHLLTITLHFRSQRIL
jgi:hypothetical protein